MDDKEIQALVLAFQRKAALDPEIRAVMKKVAAGNADFSDTSKLFLRRSNLLRAYMQEIVPKLSQGDRERLCMALLREGYTETNDVMKRVQEALDKPQGIHLNPVQADFPQERAQTVAHALEDPTVLPETILRRAGAPVGNVDMSFHDSFIKVNAQKRHDLGLKPFITRYGAGCCKWCAEISGKFRFGEQPADIFRRHDNCNCVIVYDTQVLRGKVSEDGKRTRTWEQVDPEEVMQNVSEPTVLSHDDAENLQNTALGRLTLAGERDIINTKPMRISMQTFGNRNIPRMSDRELQKSIESWTKRAEEHKEYIENPIIHCPGWESYDPRKQAGLKQHWEKEIRNFNEDIQAALDELERREKS